MVSVECRIDFKFRLWVTVTDKIEGGFFISSNWFPYIWWLLFVWNGGKHLYTSDCIHGSRSETSKRQKALYSWKFRWFYEGSTQIVDMSSFFPKKDECDFLRSPVTIYKSKKMSQTDCIDLIQGQWQTTKRLSQKVTRGADTSDSGISNRQNHQNVANLKKILFILIALKSREW